MVCFCLFRVEWSSPKFVLPAMGSGVVRLTWSGSQTLAMVRKLRVRTLVFAVRKHSGHSQTLLCNFGFAKVRLRQCAGTIVYQPMPFCPHLWFILVEVQLDEILFAKTCVTRGDGTLFDMVLDGAFLRGNDLMHLFEVAAGAVHPVLRSRRGVIVFSAFDGLKVLKCFVDLCTVDLLMSMSKWTFWRRDSEDKYIRGRQRLSRFAMMPTMTWTWTKAAYWDPRGFS